MREPIPMLLVLGAEVMVDGRMTQVVRCAGDKQRPILRLEGFPDRSAAEALNGEELLVSRGEAPELEPDEWWAEDLVGCRVHDAEREVGTVIGLLELPSCEALEVARVGGQGELLVPLVSDAVREVDVERKRIEIDLHFLGAE